MLSGMWNFPKGKLQPFTLPEMPFPHKEMHWQNPPYSCEYGTADEAENSKHA